MEKQPPVFSAIDEYIAMFPEEVQKKLFELTDVIKAAAPQATEKISYQMPTYYLHGNLVHFAAYKRHIGFYPAPSGLLEFRDEIGQYEGSKGAIRFPIDKPLPLDLISRIVKFRVEENIKREEGKAKKKR